MVVRTFFILVLGCLIGTACVERKQNNTFELSEIDSVESDTILLAPEKALQPDANDGLFDDFLFEFLRNPNFQKNRVKYPLPINEDVVDRGFSISENWGFNESSTSAMLFTSADALTLAKDTSLNDVIVDVLCLQTDSIRQFVFHRFAQRWWLQKINIMKTIEHRNRSFYRFYTLFTKDSIYQQQHILNPFYFKTEDDYSEEIISGSVNAESWLEYAPELPQNYLICINYIHKSDSKSSRERILVLPDVSAGMSTILKFKRVRDSWWLKELEYN